VSLTSLFVSVLLFIGLTIGGLLIAWGLAERSGKPRLEAAPVASQRIATEVPQSRALSTTGKASLNRRAYCPICKRERDLWHMQLLPALEHFKTRQPPPSHAQWACRDCRTILDGTFVPIARYEVIGKPRWPVVAVGLAVSIILMILWVRVFGWPDYWVTMTLSIPTLVAGWLSSYISNNAEMTLICRFCGGDVPENGTVCEKCGKRTDGPRVTFEQAFRGE